MCIGNQQVEGAHYQSGDLYAPVMKASKVRLPVVVEIAALYGCKMLKTEAKQTFCIKKLEMRRYESASQNDGQSRSVGPTGRCTVFDEEHVWHTISYTSMAPENFRMGGITWIHGWKQ